MLTVTVAVPLEFPKQSTGTAEIVAETATGCVTTTDAVIEQAPPSVTVTVYVPAGRPEAVSVL